MLSLYPLPERQNNKRKYGYGLKNLALKNKPPIIYRRERVKQKAIFYYSFFNFFLFKTTKVITVTTTIVIYVLNCNGLSSVAEIAIIVITHIIIERILTVPFLLIGATKKPVKRNTIGAVIDINISNKYLTNNLSAGKKLIFINSIIIEYTTTIIKGKIYAKIILILSFKFCVIII
jgi:hypothetical protein